VSYELLDEWGGCADRTVLDGLIAGVKGCAAMEMNAVMAQCESAAAQQRRTMSKLVETMAATVDIMMPSA
jgi:hypothetical protein